MMKMSHEEPTKNSPCGVTGKVNSTFFLLRQLSCSTTVWILKVDQPSLDKILSKSHVLKVSHSRQRSMLSFRT